MQINSLYRVILCRSILLGLLFAFTTHVEAQLLEGRGKLKTVEKEKKSSSSRKTKNAKPSKEGSQKSAKVRVRQGQYSTNTKREAVNPKYSIKKGGNKREAVNPKYSQPGRTTKREEVNPKYSIKSKNEKRIVVYPKYSKSGDRNKRIEVNPKYSAPSESFKRTEVSPRFTIREKNKRIEVSPRYSIKEDPTKRQKVDVRYSKNLGFDNRKKVVPKSITGTFKEEKYNVKPRFSIYEPFESDKRRPLSISHEGMVFDNRKERRKYAVKNDPILAQAKGFRQHVVPNVKRNTTEQTNFAGFNIGPSKAGNAYNRKRVATTFKKYEGPYSVIFNTKKDSKRNTRKFTDFAGFDIAPTKSDKNAIKKGTAIGYRDYKGPYSIEPIKRKKEMHPSAAYLGAEGSSSKRVKKAKREFNIFWVRINGNKNVPDNVKKLEKSKPGRDKKEKEIWVY